MSDANEELRNLAKLSENDAVLRTPSEDLRGRIVVDINGEQMGRVEDLYVDPEDREVRFLRINTEEFLAGRKLSLTLPAGAVIDATDDGVQVDRDKNQVV